MARARSCWVCVESKREQFEAVREGLHPEQGILRPRHSADRIDANGSEQSKAGLCTIDLLRAESVSILALVGGDERLIAAHDNAVRSTS